jgi:LysR family hydrogen peroxide-inducible transcriptional activator
MMNITLKQLRYVEALAQHQHFGRAAAACSVTQPALSAQIKDLELLLGAALFERGARTLRMTSFGETFVARVGPILRSVDELEDLARAAQDRLMGRLRIGIIPTIAPYLLPAVARRLGAEFAGLELQVRESLTSKLLEELAQGRLDTAILALPIGELGLQEMPLFDEEFLLVRPLADAAKPVPPQEVLKHMKLLLLEEGHCFRDQALSFCETQALRPREMLDGSSLSTLVQMVGAGMGVTLIPQMAAPVETRSAAVALARFETPRPQRRVGMVWRRSNPLAGQLQQVAELVRRTAEDWFAEHIDGASQSKSHGIEAALAEN